MSHYFAKKRIKTMDGTVIKKGEELFIAGDERQIQFGAIFGMVNFETKDKRLVTITSEGVHHFITQKEKSHG
jgi:hypothetical protein